jgi:hypothetical protein
MNINDLKLFAQTIPQSAQDFAFSVQQDMENADRLGIRRTKNPESPIWIWICLVISVIGLIWLWRFLKKRE